LFSFEALKNDVSPSDYNVNKEYGTISQITWNTFLLEKLTVAQLGRTFLAFIEPELLYHVRDSLRLQP
jgi:hypothetical protein